MDCVALWFGGFRVSGGFGLVVFRRWFCVLDLVIVGF